MDVTVDRRNTFEFDIFVGYARIDDEPMGSAVPWVSQFVHALTMRLHVMTGRAPRIWFVRHSTRMDARLGDQVKHALRSSALFVAVLSPSFLASKECIFEMNEFVKTAGPNRVVKVAKFPSDRSFPLPSLPTHVLFHRTTEGLPQELLGDRYQSAVDGLARQIALLIDGLAKVSPNAESGESRMEVFLCHSSSDKRAVRNLWETLKADGFALWLDEKELLPGQNWQSEISKAINRAGAIIVCLSNGSINKEGYLQREIKMVLDKASEMPDDTIFLIPARVEECLVPRRLQDFQLSLIHI